jgi:hypothetical protein
VAELNPYLAPADEPKTLNRPIRHESAEQAEVNSLLRRGVVFSIIWLMGFGSVYALFLAWRAHRIMRTSDQKLRGNGKLVWCIAFGLLGVSFWFIPIIVALVTDH